MRAEFLLLASVLILGCHKVSTKPCVPAPDIARGPRETVRSPELTELASLSGMVMDFTGSLLPDAKVQLLASDWTTVLQATYSDAHGGFSFSVPDGTYQLRISHCDLDQTKEVTVRVKRGAAGTLTVKLQH